MFGSLIGWQHCKLEGHIRFSFNIHVADNTKFVNNAATMVLLLLMVHSKQP